MKILIVDDSKIVRDSLSELVLKIPGVTTSGKARDTSEGEELIHKTKPDIVILDIRMSGGNGMSLIKKMKDQYPSMVVIMFTDYPYQLYRERSLELGADYFFEKSTEFEKLILLPSLS